DSAREFGFVDFAGAGAGRAPARLRDRGRHPAIVRGRAAGGGRLALPRAAAHAAQGLDRGRVGRDGARLGGAVTEWLRRLRALAAWRRRRRELDEELALHRELLGDSRKFGN